MTGDEHCKLLGKLVGNLQSLEFILRAFLQELPSARPIGIAYGTGVYAFPVGTELPESELTSYDSLRDLIKSFNAEMQTRGLPTIDQTIVELRDALAHGRVSSCTPDESMRLLKFSKPCKGFVRVVFNEQMTTDWFRIQIKRVLEAVLAVYAVMSQ